MNRHAFCLIAVVFLSPAFCQQPLSDPEYRKLRDAQVSETVVVENVVIRRDVGVITLRRGTISFGPVVLGRVTGGVFVGEGTFTLLPAVPYERDHIKITTGTDSVNESFDRALLFFTDNAYRNSRARVEFKLCLLVRPAPGAICGSISGSAENRMWTRRFWRISFSNRAA